MTIVDCWARANAPAELLNQRLNQVEWMNRPNPKDTTTFAMLLEDKSIDAVTHAKPLALTDYILGVPGGHGHRYRQALHASAGRVGRTEDFDLQAEQVIGNDEANLLLRDGDRGYRPPFVVPENV